MSGLLDISESKPIALFASGHSVGQLTVDNLLQIKSVCYIVSTNVPLTVIDERITSDAHAFGDLRTLEYAVQNVKAPYITRKHIATKPEAKGVPFAVVFDAEKMKGDNTFFWVFQYFLDNYKNRMWIFGLDYDIPEHFETPRWYDRYVNIGQHQNVLKYEKTMLYRDLGGESFKEQFEEYYRANYDRIRKRCKFMGWYQPPRLT